MPDINTEHGVNLGSAADLDSASSFECGEYFSCDNFKEHLQLIEKLDKNRLYLLEKNRLFVQNSRRFYSATKPIRHNHMQFLNDVIDELRIWKRFYAGGRFQEPVGHNAVKNPFEVYAIALSNSDRSSLQTPAVSFDRSYQLFLEDIIYAILGVRSKPEFLSFTRILKMKEFIKEYDPTGSAQSLKSYLTKQYCASKSSWNKHYSPARLNDFVDHLFVVFSELDKMDPDYYYPHLMKGVSKMACKNQLLIV